ncbi:MAG: KilA-N domain-containing protein [Bacteroidia bacterium]|nr:KilA-N domain-containing protein [Bacteroidia bacterium]
MAAKVRQIKVKDVLVSVTSHNQEDFICLTDIAKGKEGASRAADIIKNWMRNRSTLEFLGTWEQLYNPDFKVVEFDHFRMEAGLPTFVLSPSQWVEKTNALGIISRSGRYGGTYAHRDIALEFGSAISPAFKIYLIKEYQRLKEVESNQYNLEWNVARVLSKLNYHLQTDAVKSHIIPSSNYTTDTQWLVYAEEADVINVALFGCTAREWRNANPEHASSGKNIRDFASINELAVLANLETINSVLIQKGIKSETRFAELSRIGRHQLTVLNGVDFTKSLKRISGDIYSGD